jgi:hypothetical protein
MIGSTQQRSPQKYGHRDPEQRLHHLHSLAGPQSPYQRSTRPIIATAARSAQYLRYTMFPEQPSGIIRIFIATRQRRFEKPLRARRWVDALVSTRAHTCSPWDDDVATSDTWPRPVSWRATDTRARNRAKRKKENKGGDKEMMMYVDAGLGSKNSSERVAFMAVMPALDRLRWSLGCDSDPTNSGRKYRSACTDARHTSSHSSAFSKTTPLEHRSDRDISIR